MTAVIVIVNIIIVYHHYHLYCISIPVLIYSFILSVDLLSVIDSWINNDKTNIKKSLVSAV